MQRHIDDNMNNNIPRRIPIQNQYICHICNSSFKSKSTLRSHFKTKNDELHKRYKEKIALLEKTYADVNTLDELKCLGCESCKSCYTCDKIKDCGRFEAIICKKNKARLKKKDKEKSLQARELLKYFYSQTDQYAHSINVEIALLYNCLKNHSYECVKTALDIRIEEKRYCIKGLSCLQLQNAQIYLVDIQPFINEYNSIPFLIKQYYTNLKLSIPMFQFIKDYKFIRNMQEIYKINDEQLQYLLQYAINKKIVPLIYIKNNIMQILSIYQGKEQKEQIEQETNYLSSAILNLKQGNITYAEVIKIYGLQEIFLSSIIEALKTNQYNQNFSSIEWLYNIQVPLTKDMYFLAKSLLKDKLYHFTNDQEINNFKQWLKNYKLQFEE